MLDIEGILDQCSDDEAEVLRGIILKLGLGEVTEEKKKRNTSPLPRNAATKVFDAPSEYHVLYNFRCNTCNHTYEQYMFMKRSDDGKALCGVSLPFKPDSPGIKFTTFNKKVRFCSDCRTFLGGLTKDELIERLLEELRRF